MLANTPAMLECHYGVPMTGAVLHTLNTRLDAAIIAFSLDHGEAKVLITDREFSKTDEGGARRGESEAARHRLRRPGIRRKPASRFGEIDYEAFIANGDPDFAWRCPTTSGTRSRSTTPRARPAIRRASSITTAAPL